MAEPACPKCGGPIPADRRADSRYCSQTCKRAAELERRRLQHRLLSLETWQAQAPAFGTPEEELSRILERIDTAEARLRLLLVD
jgi:predicted nucleic acid-binding Zn ribbon protein